MNPTTDDAHQANQGSRTIWIALVVGGGMFLSPFFACVTPFAALATLAALKLGWRQGLVVLGLVWLANQATGYFYLSYPWTWNSLAWGVAIGIAAGVAILAATALSTARPAPLAISLPFVAAFTAFELTLYAAGFVLPGSDRAFSVPIISNIFLVNALTLCVLAILYHLTMFLGLQTRLDAWSTTTAGAATSR